MEKQEIGNAIMYLGDCTEILPILGDFDAVVTDPPYGIGADKSMHKQSGSVVGHGHRKVAKKTYENTNWDDLPLSKEMISVFFKISNYQIIFGGNYFELPPTKCWLIWDKLNAGNHFADCEMAWTNLDKAVRIKKHLWNGFARQNNEERFNHPTQKPVGIMEWVISHLPNDVQTIIDPFMGSGTTGVACIKMEKQFVGIERERKYFDIACKRIEDAQRQERLF